MLEKMYLFWPSRYTSFMCKVEQIGALGREGNNATIDRDLGAGGGINMDRQNVIASLFLC